MTTNLLLLLGVLCAMSGVWWILPIAWLIAVWLVFDSCVKLWVLNEHRRNRHKDSTGV